MDPMEGAVLIPIILANIVRVLCSEGRTSLSDVNSCNAIPWLHHCESNGYDKMIPPQMAINGQPTPVQIQIYIESIGNFKAGSMDYDMDIYFIEFWSDPRLQHNHTKHISINSRHQLDRIWVPDIYFANSKKAEYNHVTVPNYVLKLEPNGTARFSVRIHLKIACHMDLQAYPIDFQRCYLKIVTYGSTKEQVNVSWITHDNPIILNPDIIDTDLRLHRVVPEYCNGTYFDLHFSCLLAVFYLRRNVAYSLLQTYLPTTFIVCISWISFWIDPTSVPGRVGLAVTTLLTLSTHAIGLHYQLPPVGYAKAQDVWFGVCILFLFAALVEFALVNMYARKCEHVMAKLRAGGWRKRSRQLSKKDSVLAEAETHSVNSCNLHTMSNGVHIQRVEAVLMDEAAKECERKATKIDACSRILFPCAFAVISIVYWCIYLLVYRK